MKNMFLLTCFNFYFIIYLAFGRENNTFIVAVEQWIPFTSVRIAEGGAIQVKGPMGHLMDILANKLNAKFTFVRPPDGLWGAPTSNGSWSGMIGMLHRKEADIAVGPFTMNWAREQVSDFSIPLIMDSKSLMMQRPRLFSDVFAFLNPFPQQVYIAVVVCLIIMTLTYRIVVSSEEKLFDKHQNPTLQNAFFWATKTLLQEASKYYPQTDGSKVLVGTWLLATFILMTSYGGVLTAMMTVPKVEIPIDSIEDLASQDRYSWKLEAGSSTYYYFQEAKNEIQKKIFNNMNGTFHSCFKSCSNIGRGEFVGICDFTTIKKCMHWDFRIRRMHQAGLFDKWLKDEMVNASQCLIPPSKDRQSSQSVALKLDNFSGSFYTLLLGLIFAFFALLIEIVWNIFGKK